MSNFQNNVTGGVIPESPVLDGISTQAEIASRGLQKLEAENKAKMGQFLVIGGFFVALIGMFFYCSSVFYLEPGAREFTQFGARTWFGLGTIGLGVVFWLAGNFLHLNGLMEMEPPKEEEVP